MDESSKKTATKGLLALLVIVNFVTLATLWFFYLRRPRFEPPPRNEGRGPDVQMFLRRELDLNEDQARKFEELRDAFLSSLPALQEDIQRLRVALMSEMFVAEPDVKKIDTLAAEIGAREADMTKRLFYHFKDLVAVCRPDQKQKFELLMSDLLRMIGPPGPPRGDEEREGHKLREASPLRKKS
jgi:hypothetical protein